MANGVIRWRHPVGVLDFNQLLPSVTSVNGAAFQRRNYDETVDYDPASNQRVRRRKESSQWQHPTGPNQFQQYSTVLDEKTTVAPDLHRTELGHFEYFLAAKSDNERTKAVRSEQRIAETRRLVHPGGDGGLHHQQQQHQQLQTARSVVRLVTKVESVTTTRTTSGGSINNIANDWKHDIALLEGTCNRLDHSIQLSKKNLSKNGSLSQRRRPSRSNLKGNMSDIFKNGAGVSADKKANIYNNHLLIESSAFASRLGFNDRSRPSDTNVSPTTDGSSEGIHEIPCKLEPPDLIRSVKEHDDDDDRSEERNWLLEAKNRLRRSTSHLQPFEVTGSHSDEARLTNRPKEVHGNNGSSNCRYSKYSSLGRIVMNAGHETNENETDTESEHLELNLTKGYGCVGTIRNGCQDNGRDAFESPNELGSESSGENDDDCATVIENASESKAVDTDMGNLLEKNKSKSTSNLDDDETIEAPWFRDAKYRKTKFMMREFAKSSQDLQYGEGDRLLEPQPSSVKREVTSEAVIVEEDDAVNAASEVTVNGENICSGLSRSATLTEPLLLPFIPEMSNDNVIIVTAESRLDTDRSMTSSNGVKTVTTPVKRIDDSHKIRLNNVASISNSKETVTSGVNRKSLSWLLSDLRLRKVASGSAEWDTPSESSDDGLDSRRRSLSSPQLQCQTLEFHDESEDDGCRWPATVEVVGATSKLPSSWSFAGTSSLVDSRHIESINIGRPSVTSKTREEKSSNDYGSFMSKAGDVVVVTGDSLLDEDAWQRIELEIERNRGRTNDRQLPDWIREAEDKRRGWASGRRDLSFFESPQRSSQADEDESSKPSWMDEVKLRSTEASRAKNDCPESESSDRDGWSPMSTPSDDDHGDGTAAAAAVVNCGTAWRYVHLKPVNVGRKDVTERPMLSFEDTSDTSDPVSSSSHFNVERYVKRHIDRSREDKECSVGGPATTTTTGKEPDWLKLSQRKSRSIVDWNSLDHLNDHKSPESHCASWSDVQLRKTTKNVDSTTEMSKRVTPTRRSQASHQTANWVSKVQLKPAKPSAMQDDIVSRTSVSSSSSSLPRHRPTFFNGQTAKVTLNGKTENDESRQRSSPFKSDGGRDKSSKKVTFDIPRIHQSSPDLLVGSSDSSSIGYPEWVRIAERKGSKRINWDNFEKRETSSRCTEQGKWITEVQLRHVPMPTNGDADHATPDDEPEGRFLSFDSSVTECRIRNVGHRKADEESISNGTFSFQSSSVSVDLNGQREDCASTTTTMTTENRYSSSVAPKWLQIVERSPRERMKSLQSQDEVGIDRKVSVSDGLDVKDVKTLKGAIVQNGQDGVVDATKTLETNEGGKSPKQSSEKSYLTPSWIQLAKLKRSSSIDWTNIDRDVSSKAASTEEVHWLQDIRLRSTPTSPSKFDEEAVKFDEQYRATSTENVVIDGIRWPDAKLNKDRIEVDRWQALYQNLFDDLLSQPSSSITVGSSSTGLNASAVRLRPCRSRNWTSILEGGHRKRLNSRHQRFYSLPEMASCAVPRDDHEVEIIQLAPSCCAEGRAVDVGNEDEDDGDEDDDDDDETDRKIKSKQLGFVVGKSEANMTDEDDGEGKPIIFVKLRPTEKKSEGIHVNDKEEVQSAPWLQDVKLRRSTSSSTDSMASRTPEVGLKRTRTYGDVVRIRGNPVTIRASSVSPVTTVAPSPSIRDVIHQDIRQEVARREQTRSTYAVQDSRSAFTGSTAGKALAANKETKEKDVGLSYPSKPGWMLELQRKKAEKSKTQVPSQIPIESKASKSSTSDVTAKSTPPSFGSVLDQIRSMGKDNLFSCLRKTRIEMQSPSSHENGFPSTAKVSTETHTNVSFDSSAGDQQNASSDFDRSHTGTELLVITSDDIVSSSSSSSSSKKDGATNLSPPSSSNRTSSPTLLLDDRFDCQMTSRNSSSRTSSPSHVNRHYASDERLDLTTVPSHVITVTSKWQKTEGGNETFLHEVIVKNHSSKPEVQHRKSPETGASEADLSVKELLKLRRHNTVQPTASKSRSNDVKFSTTESDELKSPLLLRTLMSGLPKSKVMYSSDTELNLHSQDRSTGLLPASKLVASNRSLLSLTSVSPSATVPYYLMGPRSLPAATNGQSGKSPVGMSASSSKELHGSITGSDYNVQLTNTCKYEFSPETSRVTDKSSSERKDGSDHQSDGRRWLPDGQRWRPEDQTWRPLKSATVKKEEAERNCLMAVSDFSDFSVKVGDREQLRIVKRSEQNRILTSE